MTEILDTDLYLTLVELFGLDRLYEAGLLTEISDGQLNWRFDLHRLLFFYFTDGRPVYVQGRDIDDRAEIQQTSPVGLHSPILFNADLLEQAHDTVYICDGPVNTLQASAKGLPAVGVPDLFEFRRAWFKRFSRCKRVIILFGPDRAGQRRAAELQGEFRLRGIRAEIGRHPCPEKLISRPIRMWLREDLDGY